MGHKERLKEMLCQITFNSFIVVDRSSSLLVGWWVGRWKQIIPKLRRNANNNYHNECRQLKIIDEFCAWQFAWSLSSFTAFFSLIYTTNSYTTQVQLKETVFCVYVIISLLTRYISATCFEKK